MTADPLLFFKMDIITEFFVKARHISRAGLDK